MYRVNSVQCKVRRHLPLMAIPFSGKYSAKQGTDATSQAYLAVESYYFNSYHEPRPIACLWL